MKVTHYFFSAFLALGCYGAAHGQTISTVAGTGTPGYTGDGAAAISATLSIPSGVAVDGSGNMYIADAANNVVRKVTAAGTISTFAGSNVAGYAGDGLAATLAKLNSPIAIAIDGSGNVFISDNQNNCIREVNASTGIITTVAGSGGGPGGFAGDNGPATLGQMWAPVAITFDHAGNLYIADDSNNRVREVVTSSGDIITYAGSGVSGYLGAGYSGDTGPATAAKMHAPSGLAFNSGGTLFISDDGNARIRAVDPSTFKITTYAGNGVSGFLGDGMSAGSAELNNPGGLAVNSGGDLYIADASNNRVRVISGTSFVISTAVGGGPSLGDGGPATAAKLVVPADVKFDGSGNMYIADAGQNRIRKVTAGTSVKILGDTAVCKGKTSTLTDATTGGTWTSGTLTVATIGATSGIVTGVATGTSIITYNTGTSAAYQTVSVSVCKMEVEPVPANENGLKIFPNPNEGTFTMVLTADHAAPVTVTITNIIGMKVKEFVTATNTKQDIQLDGPSGIYFLNASTPGGRWSEKITVIH